MFATAVASLLRFRFRFSGRGSNDGSSQEGDEGDDELHVC